MIHDADLARHLAPLARTVETVIPEHELLKKLDSGRTLRCKLGLDPTSTTVHIGNGVVLWNLRRLQDMGHTAVLILGDYTATVGDPSGKDKTRPVLTPEQVEANLATWLEQMALILDMSKVEIRRNSEWFKDMTFLQVMDLTNRMTVQQMMERDSFEQRWKSHTPISLREFVYCLMQGWDSVQVEADVELGGTDQTFNLSVGRRLMEQEGMEPQVSLISPLLEGTDGHEKMSKSLNNAIGLTDDPKDQFGMAMRVSDELMPKYMRLTTDLSDARIDELLAGSPMDAKKAMAAAIVERYHAEGEGDRQREEFERIFSRRETPTDLPEVTVPPPGDDGLWWIVDLLKACDFANSTGDARRFVEQGSVKLDEATVEDWRGRLDIQGGEVLRVGRRKQARLTL
ncbi:MAG: tyrosine--tRNA ligase [Planctomycetota bacterium]|nr:tyrosine--tRNA ligase [Planctomycetota bacterium]